MDELRASVLVEAEQQQTGLDAAQLVSVTAVEGHPLDVSPRQAPETAEGRTALGVATYVPRSAEASVDALETTLKAALAALQVRGGGSFRDCAHRTTALPPRALLHRASPAGRPLLHETPHCRASRGRRPPRRYGSPDPNR